MQMAAGRLSPGAVRILFVCRMLGINSEKTDPATLETVKTLAAQVTFPISVVYPDHNAVLSELREAARKIPPERLPPSAMTACLQRLDYRFVIDDCFCAQLYCARYGFVHCIRKAGYRHCEGLQGTKQRRGRPQ
jgi:hypothetical protein